MLITRRRLAHATEWGFVSALLAACSSGKTDPVLPPSRIVDIPAAPTGRGTTVGLGIIGLIVADLRRSLAFYHRLGLDVPAQADGDSYRLQTTTGQVFFWEQYSVVQAFDRSWKPPQGDRRVVLEFGFATPHDVDATFHLLTSAGAPPRLPPFWQSTDIRYAIVEDPDGNQLSLRFPPSS